jgi:hypothetical protein
MFDVTLTANFQHQSQLVDIDKVKLLKNDPFSDISRMWMAFLKTSHMISRQNYLSIKKNMSVNYSQLCDVLNVWAEF